ncbi:PKD domain-containing protein [Microbacterium sp. BK668]|uniref:PKD domain-containing protein n=1 Tax=Microbacterium sp. BK668 TaxID=2512118 RepID=UPI0010E35B70|nr:PKD domain-containing protein [Microbacterium sp. BK668]TDN90932.1 PKD domain-containing protein [Microbacterium sp. BK668]
MEITSSRGFLTVAEGDRWLTSGRPRSIRTRRWRVLVLLQVLLVSTLALVGAPPITQTAWAETTTGPLHTTGADGVIYNAANEPVRLVGYNWTGMEAGGRNDFQKVADVCGFTWRTPADRLSGLTLTYDDFYQNLRTWGYNVIRLPMQWNNLEPIAPTWDAQAGRYIHNWNPNYLNDLRSMVTKAKAAGIMVILDMQQDFWSPALHNITNWDGTRGYCEGYGMPRWMYPSIDAKATTTQSTDFYNGMNWFFRNIHDPMATVTRVTPWELYADVWRMVSYEFSAASGFPAHQAVVGADLFNEPWWSYVGGNPPAGQTVAQAAGARLHAFYTALAPAITVNSPSWLLIFQDTGGGYNIANPSLRDSPWMTGKPSAPGNWVYSVHAYNFGYGTFSDGVPRHDDFGINHMNAVLANARAWGVPLYIGEFTNFSLKGDARTLTSADMAQTRLFVDWAKQNGVSWTFWAYLNPYLPMTMMDYATNRPLAPVKEALDSGLGGPAGSNQPPVAAFTTSVNSLQVAFNGSTSSDPDGTIATWSWNFGDGRTGSGATPTVTYLAAGTYTVTLTVTDDRGATASTSSPVTVGPPPGGLYAVDSFSRTVTAGWGSAETGGAWSLAGGANTSFWVAGGAGQMSVASGTTRSATLNAVQQNAVELATRLSFDRAQTGGGTYISIIGRRVSASSDYRLKIRVQSNGTVTPQLVRVVNGAETVIQSGTALPGVAWTEGEKLRIRLRVSGTAPTALSARAWEDGAAEPAAWQVSGTDSTSALQISGGLGVSSYLSSSATGSPMVIAVDEFEAGTPGGAPAPNSPPVASFTSSCTGLQCTFNGSGSSDADGTIVGYSWSFGDGQGGTGPTASHSYAGSGTYSVAMTVTDDQGATASSTGTVVVSPVPTTVHAADAFTRTVSGGWGAADVGGAWSSASPANLSVSGGTGNLTSATAGSGPSVYLPGVSSTNTDVTIAARTDKPATGGGVYLSVAPRRVSGVGDYRAKIRLQSDSQVSVQLVRIAANGTETALTTMTTVPGVVYSPTTGLRVRVQATGTNPTTLRARVWGGGAAEPSTWHAATTDSTAALQVAGGLALMSYLSGTATNAPLVTRFDDLSAVPVP